MKDKIEEFESFNPNNPEHLKGFENWVKKMGADYGYTSKPTYLVIPKELWRDIKKSQKSSLNFTPPTEEKK